MTESTIIDLIKVLGMQFIAATITITFAKEVLSVVSISVALSYTVYKWRIDYKRNKKK